MKFTEYQVLNLRAMYLEGSTQQELADLMGVSQSTICKLVKGSSYINVPKPAMTRQCKDCHAPLSQRRKRCPECQQKWQDVYFRQWYERRKATERGIAS